MHFQNIKFDSHNFDFHVFSVSDFKQAEIALLSISNWRYILSFISFGLLAPFCLEAGLSEPLLLYGTSRFVPCVVLSSL